MTEQSPLIRVRTDDKAVWDEFLARSHSNGTEVFHQFMSQLRLVMDLLEPNRKLLFMFEMNHHGTNKWVILRLSDNFEGMVTPTDDILEAFGYKRGSRGELIDTREVKKDEKKDEE